MGLKLTTAVFVEKAKEIHGTTYDYSEVVYSGARIPVVIGCQYHGAFQQVPNYHLSGNGCKACGKGNARRQSLDQILARCRAKQGDAYDYSEVRKLWKDRISTVFNKFPILCETHGAFNQTLLAHYSGAGCPACAYDRGPRLTQTEMVARFQSIWGDTYDYSSFIYNGYKKLSSIVCLDHGEFQTTPERHELTQVGCPHCQEHKRLSQLDRALRVRIEEMSKGNIEVRDRFIDSRTDLNCYCKTHRRTFTKSPECLSRDPGCPSCTRKCPKEQQILRQAFPESLENVRNALQIEAGGKLRGKEIDLYWPEHRFGVEVHGVYWHSERTVACDYHQASYKAARSSGVRLLQLWDWEIREKPELVVHMIQQRLGQIKRLYARNLEVFVPDRQEVRAFFDHNHLQGGRHVVGIALGLRTRSGRCAAIMTFSASDKWGCDYELTRFANHRGITVVGGASKLLKAFERLHCPLGVYSFADLRYSYGDLYHVLGFRIHGELAPDYAWSKGNRMYPKESARHSVAHKLIGQHYNKELTETEYMQAAGYSKIWDCGKLRFVKLYIPKLPRLLR